MDLLASGINLIISKHQIKELAAFIDVLVNEYEANMVKKVGVKRTKLSRAFKKEVDQLID